MSRSAGCWRRGRGGGAEWAAWGRMAAVEAVGLFPTLDTCGFPAVVLLRPALLAAGDALTRPFTPPTVTRAGGYGGLGTGVGTGAGDSWGLAAGARAWVAGRGCLRGPPGGYGPRGWARMRLDAWRRAGAEAAGVWWSRWRRRWQRQRQWRRGGRRRRWWQGRLRQQGRLRRRWPQRRRRAPAPHHRRGRSVGGGATRLGRGRHPCDGGGGGNGRVRGGRRQLEEKRLSASNRRRGLMPPLPPSPPSAPLTCVGLRPAQCATRWSP